MAWYYSIDGRRQGPITDSEFENQARTGAIPGTSLVWREGMPDWQPLSAVRPDLLAGANAAVLDGVAVSAQRKDLLVQSLREGVAASGSLPGAAEYVGFWWRVLARIIDNLVMQVVGCVLAIPFGLAGGLMGGMSQSSHSSPELAVGQMLMQAAMWLAVMLLNCAYFTWMTGKYGGTLGKLAFGFRVVTPDGRPVTYGRAFGRWAAESFISKMIQATIVLVIMLIVVAIFFGGISAFGKFDHMEEAQIIGFAVGLGLSALVGGLLGSFPWIMAGFDPEKRTLHDRICSTRVIKTR